MTNSDPEKRPPSTQADLDTSVITIRELLRLLRVRYTLPAVHAFCFLAMWVCYGASNQGLSEGLAGVFFDIVSVADLPFSIVAFGVMFEGGKYATFAVVAWGFGGTLWWYLLGFAIDILIRRRSRSRNSDSTR